MVVKGHPTSTEKILGTLDHLYDVNVQVWNGSAWGNLLQATGGCSTFTYRAFDIEYENSTGHGMLVYGLDSATNLGYRTWDGSSWSGQDTFEVGAIGEINWVTLAHKVGSNEILGGFQDAENCVYAAVWDGSSWGNATWCEQTAEGLQCSVDVAYERGGDYQGMVVWGDALDDRPRYRIWNGSDWSEMRYAIDQGVTDIRWVKLDARPLEDDIILGIEDGTQSVTVQVWDGASWGAFTEVETATGSYARRVFDVSYESSSGDGIVVFGDNTSIPKYRIYSSGDWGPESPAGDIGAVVYWVQLAADPVSDDIMLMTSDADSDYNVQKWSGAAWGAVEQVLETGYILRQSFDLTYTQEPTGVMLGSFTARSYDRLVNLIWETGAEVNLLGFNLYRSNSAGGTYEQINAALITATGGLSGEEYSFTDREVENGKIYYYRLEAVYFSDRDTVTVGPVAAQPRSSMIRVASGDYAGDGKAGAAIFRPASGRWEIEGIPGFNFGIEGDIPISGDYDGEGITRAAIFRPASGLWAIRGLSRNYFGSELDIPVPADYDGDGCAGIAVFRDQSGLWAVRGTTRLYHGSPGDLPVVK